MKTILLCFSVLYIAACDNRDEPQIDLTATLPVDGQLVIH